MNRRNAIALVALLAVGATSSKACPLAYSINFLGQFGIIDLGTGVFTPLNKGMENSPDGLAGAPGGPFYTVDGGSGHLLKIGVDGVVADVGDTKTGPNSGANGISVIGSLTDGTVYALDFSNRLYRVNTKTAALTLVGLLPSLPRQELQYDGNMTTSLNGTADRLYYTVEILEGPNAVEPNVYVINPADMSVYAYSLKELPGRFIGSGLVNGNFYAFDEVGHILKVDLASYAVSVVTEYDSGITPDGPPLTGIFGVVGPIEPSKVPGSSAVKHTTAARTGRSYWPPKWSALPPRGCQ